MTRERLQPSGDGSLFGGLRNAVVITGAVLLTLFLGLLLSQGDGQQIRQVIPLLPTIVQQVAAELPTRVLPTFTPTPTATPLPPTAEPSATVTPSPTATATSSPTPIPVLPTPCPAAPEEWIAYVVVEGDTLADIAATFEASVELLVDINCLAGAAVTPGMLLYVPGSTADEVTCGPPPAWVRYLVQPGDTVFSLARRTGTSVIEIINANCLDFNARIYVNTLIYLPRLPATATPTPSPVPTNTPQPPPPPTATPQPPPPPTPTETPPPPPPTETPLPPPPTETPLPPTPTETPLPPPPTPTETPLPPTSAPPPTF